MPGSFVGTLGKYLDKINTAIKYTKYRDDQTLKESE